MHQGNDMFSTDGLVQVLAATQAPNNPATITMNSAITETATWEHQYRVNDNFTPRNGNG